MNAPTDTAPTDTAPTETPTQTAAAQTAAASGAAPRRIIIDTDPGQDDAVAILLALASPELDVLGITAVAGNVPLALTERNARALVELAGRDVPVRAGADAPLARPLVTAEHVHGKTGLDGWDVPAPSRALAPGHGADWIAETVMDEPPGTVTLVCLGPLTNAALALRRAPGIARRLERIVLMGGGYFEGGNITPMAEFNVYVDPEAADAVLRSGAEIVMAPLDVTHQALLPRDFLDALGAHDTAVARACAGMLAFFERFDVEKYGATGGPLHDPCTIAWLLNPGLFEGRRCWVGVETQSELCRGATVVDWWKVWPERKENALVLRNIDARAFFSLLLERLRLL